MSENPIKMELLHISKSFPGVKALDDVSFQLRSGTTHVLCGENGAGKSTLMKIIDGIYSPDAGEIRINGESVKINNPIQAREHGIAMIFQELSYVPDLTLAENLFLGNWPMKKGRVDWKTLRERTVELLRQEGLNYDPDVKLRSLSISDIQMLEIIKAVSNNSDIIIMDEPTSAISDRETEKLFDKIAQLKRRGASIIYISHKMDEIFRIADEITVLRDGKTIITQPASELEVDKVIEYMVGRKLENQYPKQNVPIGDVLLEVEGLSRRGVFSDISFHVRSGEIVGFAGLMGAGRTETMRALFGLDPITSGKVRIKGKEVSIRNVREAVRSGMAMLSEDRRRYGIVPIRSVKENFSLASLKQFFYGGYLHSKKEEETTLRAFDSMRVKTPSIDTPIMSLSGGNQQKVILAKWMNLEPDILIADEPTRGIDVGAKKEIYQLLGELAEKGKGILIVSSELPELIGICDRIYVLNQGRMAGELPREAFSQERIMQYAVGKGFEDAEKQVV